MSLRVRRKLVGDPEFLALPPEVRETFIAVFRELAVSDTPELRGIRYYVEELRQKPRIAPEGIFSVHVAESVHGRWLWRGVFFRKGTDLAFFAFGPRVPGLYERMSRARGAMVRTDDER